MITRTDALQATPTAPGSTAAAPAWRQALRDAVTDLDQLLEILHLRPEQVAADERAGRGFPLRVPRGFVARMRVGDPTDPLLLQVLPQARELEVSPGYSLDPLGEGATSPAPGLLHKYKGRVLMVTTGACAIHCRYCFRRHFPYSEHAGAQQDAIRYIAGDPSIKEVILSGGDPLSLSDSKLRDLASSIGSVGHVERLRLHTRLPVVLPERVDSQLLEWISRSHLKIVVVLHVNHANEIDSHVRESIARLKSAGATLLNQTVLLRNINDDLDALSSLSEALFAAGVLPYYLHVLDRVEGASHFETPETEARRLLRDLLAELPGYLVPKLVKEQAGAPSKTPIGPFGA